MTDPERAEGSDMESVEDDDEQKVANHIMDRPNFFLNALQSRFSVGTAMENLSAPAKRRIKALKQLQLQSVNLEAKFYEEVHALECKYHKMSSNLYEKRSEIVSGIYEPTDEECVWESDEEEEEGGIINDLKDKVKIEEVKDDKEAAENENVKGIPEFWLTIFKNVGMLAELVREHDEPILKHLYDIKVIFLESNPMGFILEFHFSPNEYFSNSVLTKEYLMKCAPEKNDPFSFEGPEIYKSSGCAIDWKKGKNVTVKTIKKNQKHKSRGHVRTVTKTVQNDSFFNFFAPPVVPEGETEVDDDIQALLTTDFEIGHYIRERIVPRAVLYYTGEGLEDEGDDYEEEEGDEDEDSEDEDVDYGETEDDEPTGRNNITSGHA